MRTEGRQKPSTLLFRNSTATAGVGGLMRQRLILFLLAIAIPISGATAALPCGTPVLEIDAVDKWFSWGHSVAAGPDGNFLSVDGGSVLLLDSSGEVVRRQQFARFEPVGAAAVSADDDGYLVFWTVSTFSPGSNLRLARFSADGHLEMTSTLEIGEGRRAIELDAASDGSHHLLVWTGTDAYAHRFLLNRSGVVIDRHYEIAATPPCSDITVAASERGFAVTASAQRRCEAPGQHSNDPQLQVLFLGSAGDVRTATVIEQSSKGGSVAPWNEQWVVVWSSNDGIMGRLFDPHGNPEGEASLIIAEPTSMYPDAGSNGSELFLLWYSDIVPDSSCGIRWDVAASRIDSKLRETERKILDSVFESHCPPSGYTGPFQPRGDVACAAATCFMIHGRFAAIAEGEAIRIHGGSRTYHPSSGVVSMDPIANGGYLATLLVEDALQVARISREGAVEARRVIAQLGPGTISPATTITTDGRFALITARDGTPFYGWIIDTSTLELTRERMAVPHGTWAGGPDAFLVSWVHENESPQSLQLSIFGLDGNVRLSTGVMDARYVSAAPAWIIDRFVVVGTSTETAGIFEVGAGGGPIASHPLPWNPYRISSSAVAGGRLLVGGSLKPGGSVELIVVERGGEWSRPRQTRDFTGEAAMLWNGRLWMSLSWPKDVFGEVGGDDVIHLKGRLIDAGHGEITTYSVVRGDGPSLKLLLHRLAADEQFSSVSFARSWNQLRERDNEHSIVLVRTGSVHTVAEARVTVVNPDSQPLPFTIPDPLVRFQPGEISRELWLVVPNDSVYQDLYTVLKLESANPGTVVDCDDRAVVRVLDDDEPILVPERIEILEGDEPRVEIVQLTLLGGFLRPTLIDVYVENHGHGPAARLGEDFDRISRSVLVEPGQEIVEIPITILGDRIHEPRETIYLRYWYGRDFSWTRRIVIEIIDDDPAPRRRTTTRP
jgi:hypothetical protein